MTDLQSPSLGKHFASMEVSVYRSSKKNQTYVYLPADQTYESLPEAFVAQFGDAALFLTFELHEDRKLAQVDARSVLAALHDQGFFLQLPPPAPEYKNA
ncbi:MAG: YcgL domain-containing protein [Pseudomonadaceae bacterium]|nr:YcgL domain-containing protein [Pseudomonadaceae bacterium]